MDGENIIRRFRVDEQQPDSAKAHAEWLCDLMIHIQRARRQMPVDMKQTWLWSGQQIVQCLINARQELDFVLQRKE